jgi:hypothetical protein
MVMDRGHWSNYAYGQVYKESQDLLTPHEWRLTELALASRATTIIYMRDSLENILERWGKDEMYPPTKISQLLGHYENLVTQTGALRSHLPIHMATLPDFIYEGEPTCHLRQLATECESLARTASWLPPPSQGIGISNPGFVIVGEAPFDQCEPCGDLPRFPLDTDTLLWRALDEMDTRWQEGYYTSITSFHTPTQFALAMNAMNPQVVLSLGRDARDFIRLARMADFDSTICFAAVENPNILWKWQPWNFTSWKSTIGDALAPFCSPKFDDHDNWCME